MPGAATNLLTDGDDRFTKMVTRIRSLQLGPGEVELSENGRMDVDGVWQPREGYESLGGVVLSTTDKAILRDADSAAALVLIAVSGGTDTAAIVSNVVTVTTAASHGLPSGHTSTINLAGFTAAGAGGDIDGNHTVTRTGADTFTFALTSADDTYTGGTVGPFKLDSVAVEIHGACLYSDPSDSNADYILIADNVQVTALKLSTLVKTNIAYPTSETLSQQCDMIQEHHKVVLRQNGKTAWEWDGVLTGSPAFTKVSSGAKTQHIILDTAGNTAILNGVATVTEGSHGITLDSAYDAAKDPPRRLLIVDSADYDYLIYSEVKVATVPTTGTFTYYVDAEDNTATSIVYSTKASLGGGYINMPAAPWGTYHQKRSFLPYFWDDAATPADRGTRNEIICSDILDNGSYDPLGNQFTISAGRADFVVGMHGFDDDRLLVFNRNSIHYLKGVSGSLDDVSSIQLTDEIGCVARKSIVTYANQVLFLSDQGVYAVSFQDEYNLRGTDIPLSEAVDSLIKRITPGAADKSVGIYHDNRYWLAVPLDGSSLPSHFLIYNFLNGGWESLDSTNATGEGWRIEELVQARAGKINRLYAVTTYGGIHQLDGTRRDEDRIAASVGQTGVSELPIPAILTTRKYPFGDLRRKKFNRLRAHVKSETDQAGQADLSILVEDPDATVSMGSLRDEFSGGLAAGEDGTFHKRIGNPRGTACQLKFTSESGRPKLQAVQIDAVGTFESTTSVT